MQMAAQEIKAQEALGLLKGWFNNKMMVVIFRIQYAHVWAKKTTPVDVREQLIFLNDVQHHYLREGQGKKASYGAAKWLKAFFRVYPKRITPERNKKAWQMVKRIYEGLGIRFPFNEDGVRNQKYKWYETRDRMVVSERDSEADDIIANGAAAYYLLFHERNGFGRTLAEEWERENHSGLNNDERIILKSRKNSSATVIEIQKVLDHQTMECIDLFDQNRPAFHIIDRRTAAAQMPRFTRILTWLDDYPYFSRLGAGGIVISDILRREGMGIFKRLVKRRGKPDEKTIKRYLSENFGEAASTLTEFASEKVKSMVRSMDVHECVAAYDIVREPEKIKEILDTYPEYQQEEECDQPGAIEYTWLRIGRSKAIERSMPSFFRHKKDDEGVGTLGKIRFYSDKVEVVAFSKQKYEFAKKMAEKYFGLKIRLKRESVVDLAKQVADRDRDNFEDDEVEDSEAEMPESIPPEIRQQVMEQFFRQHYTKFLDDSVPALKGMSPREAAKDPVMRPRLVELMKEHICGIEAPEHKS